MTTPIKHGTVNSYTSMGCRCEECRTAHREAMRRCREQALVAPVPESAHGTRAGYYYHGCRCIECKRAAKAYRIDLKRRLATSTAPFRHGTINGYTHHGCRCEECSAAHSAGLRRALARAALRPTPAEAHGTPSGYTYYQCRCDRCRGVRVEYQRARRAAHPRMAT